MALAIENLHGKFVREFLANNHAETYLLVGGGRKILRDLAFECAKTILDASGNVQCWGWNTYSQISNTPSGTFSQLSSGYLGFPLSSLRKK